MPQDSSKYNHENSSDLIWWEYLIPGYNTYRIIEHITDKYGKPAKQAIDDVIDNNIRRPIRYKLGLTNHRSLTERNFDSRFLNELNIITDSIAHSRYPDLDSRLERGDTINFGVNGNDYIPNYGGTKVRRSIKDRVITPRGQIETTLGSFRVRYTKNRKSITDIYDWNTRIHLDEASPYGFIRNIMGKYGTPDSIPEKYKTHIEINYKRVKR